MIKSQSIYTKKYQFSSCKSQKMTLIRAVFIPLKQLSNHSTLASGRSPFRGVRPLFKKQKRNSSAFPLFDGTQRTHRSKSGVTVESTLFLTYLIKTNPPMIGRGFISPRAALRRFMIAMTMRRSVPTGPMMNHPSMGITDATTLTAIAAIRRRRC